MLKKGTKNILIFWKQRDKHAREHLKGKIPQAEKFQQWRHGKKTVLSANHIEAERWEITFIWSSYLRAYPLDTCRLIIVWSMNIREDLGRPSALVSQSEKSERRVQNLAAEGQQKKIPFHVKNRKYSPSPSMPRLYLCSSQNLES